jgi:hypothetical protein
MRPKELTIRGLILGSLLTLVFTAANVYLGLKVGPIFARTGSLAVLFFRLLQKRIYSPEWELATDRHAIDLCIKARYDVAKCMYLFHILELIALDYGDLRAVYGLDTGSDRELSDEASLITKARVWLYSRERGYLPIQDRRAELMRHLEREHGITGIRPRNA